uniref:restriction endonuclease subunit S n=1 Tax=Phocaeicola plebeius TaxID=310297 RepID=UPI0026EF1312
MENRYDKYKDSGIAWIGEIPEHWSLVSIGKLFNIYAGGDAKPDYYSDTKDLEHPFPVYTNTKSEHEIYAYTSKAIFPANTITVTGRGDVGHAIYRRTPYDAIIRLLSLIPKNNYDCRFYTYFIDIVIPFMDGKSAVAQLSALQLKPQFVCFPSNEEQQSIATYLDQKCGEIDELITMQEEMITKLQSYKQSVITEAVTKGLDKNVPLKDSGIEWIGNTPEHWNKNK